MHLAVISDIHLGRGDKSDRFGHDDAEFLGFLGQLERSFDRIVLLGDIWETLSGKSPLHQVQELSIARNAHREIADRFERPQYTYIHGNHDLVAANVLGTPDTMRLEVDGMRLLFTHGHAYDRLARCLSETGVWLGGWLLRLGLGWVTRLFDPFDNLVGGVSRDPDVCDFQRWAVDVAASQQADVVVTGHTHMGVCAEHGDRLFMNSGSCSKGELSFLSIDTRSGSFAVNHGF